MSRESFRCPLCGSEFDPAVNPACGSCPLHNGCALVCCPNCGHSTVDPARSRLGRLAESFWGGGKHRRRRIGRGRPGGQHGRGHVGRRGAPGCLSLDQAPPGSSVRVIDLDGLPAGRQLQLQSMGLAPGRTVWVQQQTPVSVVLCGQTELALESELATAVLVELED